MKHNNRMLTGAALLGLTLITVSLSLAQTAVKETTTTTTSAGTISEFSPETLVIKTETSPEPVRYTYTKTTTYVDETGTPVSMETVKSGLPVTVYYVKDGDRMLASKVVVRNASTGMEEQKPFRKPFSSRPTNADNSARNIADRDMKTLTPLDQGNSQADVDTTAAIRKAILEKEGMSVNAQNAKIITNKGKVTLRGPVNNEEEKRIISDIAIKAVGAEHVDNQLEVKLTTVGEK